MPPAAFVGFAEAGRVGVTECLSQLHLKLSGQLIWASFAPGRDVKNVIANCSSSPSSAMRGSLYIFFRHMRRLLFRNDTCFIAQPFDAVN